MQCNIDSKGKIVRVVSGFIHSCLGLTLLLLGMFAFTDQVWMRILGGVLLGAGAFQVFEGWAGWCVVRAMGFRTRN